MNKDIQLPSNKKFGLFFTVVFFIIGALLVMLIGIQKGMRKLEGT